MQEKYLYEYAVIRIVPCVEREEFLNVGVITFCKRPKFLKVLYKLDVDKLALFGKRLDIDVLEKNLKTFEHICSGSKQSDTFTEWDFAERFRWLTAVRSSMIQTSRPHNGFSSDMDKTTLDLFKKLVL